MVLVVHIQITILLELPMLRTMQWQITLLKWLQVIEEIHITGQVLHIPILMHLLWEIRVIYLGLTIIIPIMPFAQLFFIIYKNLIVIKKVKAKLLLF